jgi:hypothetical protein
MFALLIGCFVVGVALRRLSWFPAAAIKHLTTYALSVALPALVLKSVHAVAWEPRYVLIAVVLWGLFLSAAMVALVAARRGWTSRPIAGALALSAGLGNTAFIGVPLSAALGGDDATGPAAMIDQLGSFLAFALFALPFAMMFGGDGARVSAVLRRVLTFPPFVALIAAALLRPFEFPPVAQLGLTSLAKTLSPVALVCVGWQLEVETLRHHARALIAGLTWKLLLAPATMLTILWLAGGPFGLTSQVAVAQAAMAPMATAAVLAAEHRLAAGLSAAMAAFGALLSFATVPAWFWLAERVLSG